MKTIPTPRSEKEYQAFCVNKWKRLLLAESAPEIKDPHTAAVTAVLLENQTRHLQESVNNSSIFGPAGPAQGGGLVSGDNYAKGDNRVPKTLLPLIRRMVPELISNEVVGVQPMSGPVGLAFAMRFRYEKGPLHQARSAGSLGRRQTPYVGYSYGVNTHRPGNTTYTPNDEGTTDINGNVLPKQPVFEVGADNAITDNVTGTIAPGAAGYNPNPATDMRQLEATVGTARNRGAEMGYNYLDTTYTGRLNQGFNRTINPATGQPFTDADIHAELETLGTDEEKAAFLASTQIAGGKFTFSDQDLGTAALLGDYEATGRIPRTRFNLEKISVDAGTRRIAANWTLELEQDIRNMNGIDVTTEVTSMMSYELQAEIDREIVVRMMYSALSHNEYTFFDASKADARWMAERDRVIYQYLLQQSNRMGIRNRRGVANFIIATPDVCTVLESLPAFAVMPVESTVATNVTGVAKVGTIGNGRFTVYRDTRTPVQNSDWMNLENAAYSSQYTVNGQPRTTGIPDFALLGYKGQEYWDAGIIFCPYIPIMLQQVVDPVSFEPTIGLMTRYGVADNIFGSHLYYHMVFFDTLSNTVPGKGTTDNPGQIANTFPSPYNQTSAIAENPSTPGYPVNVTNQQP